MNTETQLAPAPPAKFSRYRSVRRANTVDSAPANTVPQAQDNDPANGTMQRSMSRYRRSRAPTQEHRQPPTAPPIPMIPSGFAQEELPRQTNNELLKSTSQPERSRSRAPPDERGLRSTEERKDFRRQISPASPEPLEHTLSAAEEDERLRRAHTRTQQQRVERQKAEEEEALKILAEQKRKDLERLEIQLAAAVVARPISPPVSSSTRDRFKIFGRKRSATRSTPPHSTTKDTVGRGASHDLPMPIVRGGGVDAPVSAVNAGERRVLVRCKQASISLPITPTTTARELIYSAANVLPNSAAPDATIMLERYTKVGLERRVRRYEHIRDIMNSWDRDTQNELILEASDSPKHDYDLIYSYAPKERPGGITVHMYHSQKPGRWIKCYITLLSTGQVFISRKSGGKLTDKDSLQICHLSDFDIYKPSAEKARKSLKPPKKHCYAIKSQQKATMFLSTENFVHFFSTDNAQVAEEWHEAVQRWRSWYLVSTTGKGKQASPDPQSTAPDPGPANPYTIGSFQPLGLRASAILAPAPPASDTNSEPAPRQVPFHMRHSQSLSPDHDRARDRRRHPPVSLDRHNNLPNAPDAPFSSASLLGRTYTQRQRTAKDPAAYTSNPDFAAGPFIAGPSLLNAGGAAPALPTDHPQPFTSHPPPAPRPGTSGDGGSAKPSRAPSTRTLNRPLTAAGAQERVPKMPAPLLDFTPAFVEAPQWSREGMGRGVQAPSGVPLVDVARSADPPKDGPERMATVFRRERSATMKGDAARWG